MDSPESGRGGPSSSRGRRGRGRGKPEPQWLPKPDNPPFNHSVASSGGPNANPAFTVVADVAYMPDATGRGRGRGTPAAIEYNYAPRGRGMGRGRVGVSRLPSGDANWNGTFSAAGSCIENTNSSRKLTVNAATVTKAPTLITPSSWQQASGGSGSSSGMQHRSAATAPAALDTHRSNPAAAAVAAAAAIPLPQRSDHADRDLLQDLASKTQSRAVTARFCPVRGFQQQISQLTSQSSQPQTPPAAAAAAGAAANGLASTRPADQAHHSNPFSSIGSSSSSGGPHGTISSHRDWSSHPAAAAAPPPPPPPPTMFGTGRGDSSSSIRGRGRGRQGVAAAAAPQPSYLPGVYTAAAAADREFAAVSRGRGRGRGRAAPVTAASISSTMYPAAAAAAVAAVPTSISLHSQIINAGRLSAHAPPYTPPFPAAAAVPSTFRTNHHVQPVPNGAATAAAAAAKQQRQQSNSAALVARPLDGRGNSISSSNAGLTTVSGSSSGAAVAGFPAAAAPAGTGAFIPFASDLISSSSSRGRGRGRAREPSALAAAADTVSNSSTGRGRGRGGRFLATVHGWQPMDAAAAAAVLPGSSQVAAAVAAGRAPGRGRGRMSGYTFAGSRLEMDHHATAAAASSAAVGGSSGSSNAANLLPLDEDALFGHIRSDAAADTSGTLVVQQQQQQQQQQDQHSQVQQQQQRTKQQQVQQNKGMQQPTQQQLQQQPPSLPQAGNPAQQAAAAAATAATEAAAAESSEKLTCVVCLDQPIALTVTPCDHHQLCARCCLRLRICYKDTRCPLCKTECKKVMIIPTPAAGQPIPTFESLTSQQSEIWQKPKWCPGVLTNIKESVYVPGQKKKLPLYVYMLQMTALACRVCDPNGHQGMRNMQALSDHLLLAHGGLTLCPTCVAAHRKFPLELDTFTPQALQRHQESAHKHCEFCDRWFYAVDELWSHMNERHFLCNICQAAGTPHLYFKDSTGLRRHYAAAHHPCNEGKCADSLVAFDSEAELRQHQAERHSSKMPRYKKTNARHIMLDIPSTFPRYSGRRMSQQQDAATTPAAAAASSSSSRGASRGMQQSSSSSQIPAAAAAQEELSGGAGGSSTAAAAAAAGSGTNGRRIASAGNVIAESRAAAAASSSSSSNAGQSVSAATESPAATAAAASDPYAAVTRLAEGGLQMIDDDIGMNAEQQQQQRGDGNCTGSQQQQQQPGLTLPVLSENGIVFATNPGDLQQQQQHQQQQQPAEDFPDLAAAAAGSGPPAAAAAAGGGLVLVKATARCACGRRQMHLAIKEGQAVPKLPCDRECDLQQRRHQIADAFGVASLDNHVAHWDRHRTPNYTPTLLQAYKQDPEFIEQLEKHFMDFLSSSSKSSRMSLDPMTRAQREIVHEYAEQGWGFVSHSTGAEPNRWVQIFKTPSAGAPTQLLSQAAILMSQSAIDNMLKASAQNALTLRLVDITPGANLTYHLREWAGEYKTTNDDSQSGSVTLTFDNPKVFKSCSDQLAGGIRGVFRVERGSSKTAAAAGADGHHGCGGSSSSSSSLKPSVQRPAAAVTARSSSLAAAPAAAGWQTISKGRAAAAAAAPSGPPPVDPWADDDQAGAAAAAASSAAAAAVPDDWEEQLNNDVDVPKGPALKLEQINMWAALGDD